MANGFDSAMQMMRSRDPQRTEDGFGWLHDRAAEHLYLRRSSSSRTNTRTATCAAGYSN
ncbi:hypothetical protein [Amycolatopsis circi]|uniref:hypothetical protein n=1 Tax=Amycolatopsis circi TaxID=871959 RepID=UPI001ABFB0B8|nr:hypothetical protein [Amycolatopsis circi]